jgi:serine/threonine protein kinase
MIANIGLSGYQQSTQRLCFGSYEAVEMLSNSASRAQYVARHVISGERALLTVFDAPIQLPDRVSRFVREMAEVTQIRHESIAAVLASDIASNRPYFVVAHAPKGTLQAMLQATKSKTLKADVALDIIVKLAVAMQYSHDNGFLIGNLAPETVLFDAEGQPMLGEVGFVQALVNAGLPSNTTGVSRRGYMAPERATKATLSAASDVYALGALLHEMLTGKAPAPADGAGAQMLRGSALPQSLAEIINKALSDDPNERYETPFDFERAIVAATRRVDTGKLLGGVRKLGAVAGVCALLAGLGLAGRSYAMTNNIASWSEVTTAARPAVNIADLIISRLSQRDVPPPMPPGERIEIALPADLVTPRPLQTAQPTPEIVVELAPDDTIADDFVATAMPDQEAGGGFLAEVRRPVEQLAAQNAPVATPEIASDDEVAADLPADLTKAQQTAIPIAAVEPRVAAVQPTVAPTREKAQTAQRKKTAKTSKTDAKPAQKREAAEAAPAQTSATGVRVAVLKTGADRWGRPPEWAAGRRDVCAFIDSPNDAGGERLWRFYAQVTLTNTSNRAVTLPAGALTVRGRGNDRLPACLPGSVTLAPGAQRTYWIRTFFEGDKPAPYRIQLNSSGAACIKPVTGQTNFAAPQLFFKQLACK